MAGGAGRSRLMRLRIIAIGRKMPGWVAAGFAEYAGRMPPHLGLELRELQPGDRGKGANAADAAAVEARRMLEAIPAGSRVVALDREGRQESTEQLAGRMSGWMQDGRDISLLVGGPDGMTPSLLAAADQRWCLSRLTLPHMLVRVVLAEQLYRAWTILGNHPYHR